MLHLRGGYRGRIPRSGILGYSSAEVVLSVGSQTRFVTAYGPGRDARVELHNGRFLDVSAGAYFGDDTRVVLRDGTIEAVVRKTAAGPPADFRIDLQGKTVVPGLFNTHCHLATIPPVSSTMGDLVLHLRHARAQRLKTMQECLAHGITHLRDSHAEDLRTNRALQRRIADGRIVGPRIWQAVAVGPPGGYLVNKSTATGRFFANLVGIPMSDHESPDAGVVEFAIDADEQQVRDVVDRAIDERGADSIKLGDLSSGIPILLPNPVRMTQAQMGAAADQARKRGLKTQIHQVSVDTFRRAVAAGVTSLSHLARDADLSDADIDAFVAAGCSIEPTVSVAYDVGWRIDGDPTRDHPDMLRLTDFRDRVATFEHLAEEFYVPELRGSVRRTYERLNRAKFKAGGVVDLTKTMRYYAPIATHGVQNLRRLYARGVHMSAGNDGGVPPCTPAMMGQELALCEFFLDGAAVPLRLRGGDAMRMATIQSAEAMGMEDRFGSLDVGKVGDLVLIDGDPLDDPRLIGARAAALFKDGELVIDNCDLAVVPTAAQ